MNILSRARQLVDSALSGARQCPDGVERTRSQIADLRDERERIEAAPVAKTVAFQRLDEWYQRALANRPGRGHLAAFVAPDGRGNPDILFDGPAGRTTLIGLLAPVVREHFARLLDERYAADAGIADDVRAARLAALDEQLLDLERTEEALIRAGEAIGIDILRRHDADPRAVLAPDDALPK